MSTRSGWGVLSIEPISIVGRTCTIAVKYAVRVPEADARTLRGEAQEWCGYGATKGDLAMTTAMELAAATAAMDWTGEPADAAEGRGDGDGELNLQCEERLEETDGESGPELPEDVDACEVNDDEFDAFLRELAATAEDEHDGERREESSAEELAVADGSTGGEAPTAAQSQNGASQRGRTRAREVTHQRDPNYRSA